MFQLILNLRILRKCSKGKVSEKWPIFHGTTLLSPIACVMDFTTVNMIKTGTLCNGNEYGTEKTTRKEKKNIT